MRTCVIFVMLLACGKTNDKADKGELVKAVEESAPVKADKAERALAEMRGFADRMCGCADSACKKQVRADYDAWGKTENGQFLVKVPKGEITEEQRQQIDPIEARIRECRRQ